MGISYHYTSETSAVFKHSDCVDYGTRQFGLFAGKNISDLWNMEFEAVIADVIEKNHIKKKDGRLYGIQASVLYDFVQTRRVIFYTGISLGMGFLPQPSGYGELGCENPYGLIAGKLGLDYYLSKKYFLRVQSGVWHISSAPMSDHGQNNWDYSIQFGYHF